MNNALCASCSVLVTLNYTERCAECTARGAAGPLPSWMIPSCAPRECGRCTGRGGGGDAKFCDRCRAAVDRAIARRCEDAPPPLEDAARSPVHRRGHYFP